MKKFLAILILAWCLIGTAAEASCYTHTYIGPNGRFVYCQTCCWGNNCTTTCF